MPISIARGCVRGHRTARPEQAALGQIEFPRGELTLHTQD